MPLLDMHLSWLNSLTILAGVAQKLQREIPGGIILDQYGNVGYMSDHVVWDLNIDYIL